MNKLDVMMDRKKLTTLRQQKIGNLQHHPNNNREEKSRQENLCIIIRSVRTTSICLLLNSYLIMFRKLCICSSRLCLCCLPTFPKHFPASDLLFHIIGPSLLILFA